MQTAGKFSVRPVKILALPDFTNGELSDKVVRRCDFCSKDVEVTALNRPLLEGLSGDARFYCPFCLQNSLNTKNNRNILILSFRSVFGYFYHECYLGNVAGRRRMTFSEIEDYVAAHEMVGNQNPVFRYDPETFYWFVDFSRVGTGRRKAALEEIYKCVVNILACFNLWDNVPSIQLQTFYGKYRNAIEAFYQRRFRPDGKRILLPSFVGCGVPESSKGFFDRTRAFTRKQLCLK